LGPAMLGQHRRSYNIALELFHLNENIV
jgi:hypothetical protein